MQHGGMRINTLIDRYVDGRSQRGELAATTTITLRSNLRVFARSIGNPEVRYLSRDHVEQWLEAVKLAPSSRRTRLSQIHTFAQWAIEHRYLRVDPTIGLRPPRQPRYVPRGMPFDDVAAIFDTVTSSRTLLILCLMFQEGLRRCEVANLTMSDIDLTERLMLVNGKGGHQRVLPISDESFQALQSYLAEIPAHAGPLIRSLNDPSLGVTPATIGRSVSAAMYEAGVKRRAYDGRSGHAARHTAATDMVKTGAHVRDVQQALGHQSLATTERYLSWLVGDLRTAMGGRSYRRSGRPKIVALPTLF